MSHPVTVGFHTLGCRLNQVDSQEMAARMEARGFRAVAADAAAQIHVVNTCTVTGRADLSDRQLIRRVRREHPDALVVVTGCYAQTNPDAVARLGGVDLVIGNGEKPRLPELLAGLLAQRADAGDPPPVHVAPIAEARMAAFAPFSRAACRTRAFVKVQDGCQHRCAFCIVPAARGASRSQEPEAVLEQARRLVEAGHGEITLTGVDLGHYGLDLVPRTSLAELLRRLDGIPGLRWLRLSSVLPAYFTPELIEAVTGLAVMAPHLHVPLQSGSDRILRLMRRPYTVRMYRTLVERLLAAIPDLALGSDVIVGHPGESDADFTATMELVRAVPFAYLHVFSYSDRRGTEATRLPGRVDAAVARERSAALRRLASDNGLEFRRRLLGRTREVLVLEAPDRATGLRAGLTADYVEVLFRGPAGLGRRFVPVQVTECDRERTLGRLQAAPA
ncbi:MAG TPA: tRNA (N(6)-L-threonylcarbamoyladenosine(37)-C(2))-methylthiotransferase MtaB [Candidatus Nitrosocosmicus sp.]|nr:tRNA (N(6)-L-threonylcarbamoyladenosine(37)-C(2))-methylthiotransferase MtaB [Candidatus Nitrosocosmicus sp.]